MTDTTDTQTAVPAAAKGPKSKQDIGIGRRRFAEWRLKMYGLFAIAVAVGALAVLLYSIVSQGAKGLSTIDAEIEFVYDPALVDREGDLVKRFGEGADLLASFAKLSKEEQAAVVDRPRKTSYRPYVQAAFLKRLGIDPDDESPENLKKQDEALALLSPRMDVLVWQKIQQDPTLFGKPVKLQFLLSGEVKAYLDGIITKKTPEARRALKDGSLALIDKLVADGTIKYRVRWELLTNKQSTDPEDHGLLTGLIGSAYMMLIVLVVAVPIGVAASIYLEEYAPKNQLTDIIEVNINNLAAVPSIVFGLLGLAVFINFMELERSTPIVGGLVLSLMTLPTVIIATRAALKAVPPSIREAALGVGASKTQAVFHHVLPLALPGILTGTIIGLAQALGETAPLLVIGMNAVVSNVPTTPFDESTSLPSQIYEMASQDKVALWAPVTSASIIVLLSFLMIMNLTAVFLRRRFERKW
ncbi:MAG: phosphate ABC transporter permease PstA [Neomegalonema sp.]|nr:phosphate ABC transporter permease PstA [Neomegalonema sp.]